MLKFKLLFFDACRKISLIAFGIFLGAIFEYGLVTELALGLVVCVFLYRLSKDEFYQTAEMMLDAKKQTTEEDDA